MKATDDLFQLVKSMSRSEKGYFKKFAQKHTIGKKSVYVTLFDAIDEIDSYSEEEIKKKFKGEEFAGKIYSTKNYLFNLILKALSSYHSERFAVSKLNIMLIELNVLFEKGLYKQYRTLLKKAIEIAKKHDKGFYLAHLHEKEIKFLVTEYYEGTSPEKFQELKKKVLKNIDRLRLDTIYELLYYELFHILKGMGSVRNKKDLETLKTFMNNPLLKDKSIAINFNSKYHLYSILGHYYRAINDSVNWYKYRKILLELVESDDKYIKEYKTSYISVLNNYLNACVHIRRYRDFEKNLEKLKKFSKQFENKKEFIDSQTRLFLLISDLELNYLIKILHMGRMKETIESIEHGFKKFDNKIVENRKVALYNRIAYACFILKDYNRSIEYVNKILNITHSQIEPEQQSFARIRSLIIHFEAGNYELLEYSVKSTKRFLAKTNRMYRFEKLVLEFIRNAINLGSGKELLPLYLDLRDSLMKISVDPFEKNAIEQFDIISWLESKIKNKSFFDILKEKWLKKTNLSG